MNWSGGYFVHGTSRDHLREFSVRLKPNLRASASPAGNSGVQLTMEYPLDTAKSQTPLSITVPRPFLWGEVKIWSTYSSTFSRISTTIFGAITSWDGKSIRIPLPLVVTILLTDIAPGRYFRISASDGIVRSGIKLVLGLFYTEFATGRTPCEPVGGECRSFNSSPLLAIWVEIGF